MRSILILFLCSLNIAGAQDITFLDFEKDYNQNFKCYFYTKYHVKKKTMNYSLNFIERNDSVTNLNSKYIEIPNHIDIINKAYIFYNNDSIIISSEWDQLFTPNYKGEILLPSNPQVGEYWKCNTYFGRHPGYLTLSEKKNLPLNNDFIFKLQVSGDQALSHYNIIFEEIWFSKKTGFLMIKFKEYETKYHIACLSQEFIANVKIKDIINELRSRKKIKYE